jgi:hypothetical protein
MDAVVRHARRALADGDWEALRPLLHPYLHWTGPDGVTVRGRSKVLAELARTRPAEAPPTCELRDGQIYRWSV